ncbi:DUF2334 domain-containing protein [Metabacillus litoralis]|uniref:DUF2334 domain-containing protein n=1 Tax=Metabacillus litoralis TaxID=152268 RepID=UPI001CFE36E2|nr:DUF2334 domain-containing protein [Metabacillus litoralis]
MKKRNRKLIFFIVMFLFLVASLSIYITTFTEENIYPNSNKRHAMLRLEDVGPGGEYNSLEALGKLKAVIQYIESENIAFHIAVIPRRMDLDEEGTWNERGIDDPDSDRVSRSFIKLLKEVQQQGGILGMHGYSHQYGDSAMEGNNQNSGTGSEFKVNGAPETKTVSYAAERITNSLEAFVKNDLQPAFWESPHYQDTREQEKVFRSFIGILYQPDYYSLRSFKDINAHETINSYGQESLGSFYVPAPLGYISDQKSVNKMLSKIEKNDDLASLYYHPFMEFPYLEKEVLADGKPKIEDGLPVYKYKETGESSYLHQLVEGFKKEGYQWMTLHDIIPFTPAHRVKIPLNVKAEQILIGNVKGHRNADIVVREKHRIVLIPGTYTLPRNRPQKATEIWLKESFSTEEQVMLSDLNNDGKQDLLAYNQKKGDFRVSWAGDERFLNPTLLGKLPPNLDSLKPFQSEKGNGLIAYGDGQIIYIYYSDNHLNTERINHSFPVNNGLYLGKSQGFTQSEFLYVSSDNQNVFSLQNLGNRLTTPQKIKGVSLNEEDQLLTGDWNGDGTTDLLIYTAETGVWKEYVNGGANQYNPLNNSFGPWAQGDGRIGFAADFDGNGKTDVASFDEVNNVLDIALSYQTP